jgi:hypothetical protein|tara:strand:- start:1614 stop:2729 length:1116 start_codon:yes stop_codon:yes gene_type:complete
MNNSEEENIVFSDLMISILITAFLGMLLSHNLSIYVTEPIMRDQSVFIGSRYTITVDALNTIAEDDTISIIAMGSSMSYKGIDGECIGDYLGSGITAYNLAQPSSKPYTDMQHIPRIISANPDLVMIEIAPDILSTPSGHHPYIQLRYTLDSLYQDDGDLGEWVDIVPPEYRQWIAMNDIERMEFRQEYVPGAIEEHLNRLILDEDNGRDDGAWGWAPNPEHPNWNDYIQTPIFPDDKYGLEGFGPIKLDEYRESKLRATPWASPPSNGTLSHQALEYEISSLTAAGIEVIITTPAYHPEHLEYLENGQWDGFNETVLRFSQYEGVTIFDQTWIKNTWVHDDFYDRNHLDDDGREKYCELLIPTISEILNG